MYETVNFPNMRFSQIECFDLLELQKIMNEDSDHNSSHDDL